MDALVTELLRFGIGGVFLGVLIYANLKLWDAIKERDAHIAELNTKRIDEAIKTVMAAENLAKAHVQIAVLVEQVAQLTKAIEGRRK